MLDKWIRKVRCCFFITQTYPTFTYKTFKEYDNHLHNIEVIRRSEIGNIKVVEYVIFCSLVNSLANDVSM